MMATGSRSMFGIRVRLYTINGANCSKRYPLIADAAARIDQESEREGHERRILIVLAVFLVWRMDRLERQLEDVHISPRKILAPLDLRQTELETYLAAQKQLTAGQRQLQFILRLLFAAVIDLMVIAVFLRHNP